MNLVNDTETNEHFTYDLYYARNSVKENYLFDWIETNMNNMMGLIGYLSCSKVIKHLIKYENVEPPQRILDLLNRINLEILSCAGERVTLKESDKLLTEDRKELVDYIDSVLEENGINIQFGA